MTGSLIALEWTVLAATVLLGAGVGGAFIAELVMEFRRLQTARPLTWQPGGPQHPRTPTAAELAATLTLGMTPEAVEAQIREIAHGRERPA